MGRGRTSNTSLHDAVSNYQFFVERAFRFSANFQNLIHLLRLRNARFFDGTYQRFRLVPECAQKVRYMEDADFESTLAFVK